MHSHAVEIARFLISVWLLLHVTSCKHEEPRLGEAEVVGVWKLQESTFQSTEYTKQDFKDFDLEIRDDHSFSASNIPPGQFMNKSTEAATLGGS